MIDSLLIENFRGISSLEIQELGQISLFVGKNNTGKSSILEAVQIFAKKGSPETFEELIIHRDEDWEQTASDEGEFLEASVESPFRYLFHGYHLPAEYSGSIKIGPMGNEGKMLKINRVFVKHERTEEGRRRVIVDQEDLDWDLEEGTIEPAIQVTYANESRLFPVFRRRLARRVFPKTVPGGERVQLVPTENIPDSKLSNMWDSIELTDLQKEVIKGLQIVDSRVVDLAMLGSTNRGRGRIPIAKLRTSEKSEEGERVPLKTMGDGMTRVFHILLALVNAKDGFLLVDEFENGIHWSALTKLWDTVFRVASELNVQVIATTHSKDCVNSFFEVWAHHKQQGSFHRIELRGENVSAMSLSNEDLEDAIDAGVEVR